MSEPTTQPKAERAGEDESTPRTPKARTTTLTDTQIEAGLWLLVSRAHPLALELDETHTDEAFLDTLRSLIGKDNFTRDKVKKAIAPILAMKEAVAVGKLPQLLAARADKIRKLILEGWRISSSRGVLLWPTGSGTIVVRLGKGKWNDTPTHPDLRVSGRGRAQGSGYFNEIVMCTILIELLEATETTGLSTTLSGYTSQSKGQRALGRQDIPSTTSVRQRFGTWGKAMEFASRIKKGSSQGLGQYRCVSVFICPDLGSGIPTLAHNALLALVSFQSTGAYRLEQMFEDQTCGAWPLSVGQVYQTMWRLEHTSCVTPYQKINAGRDPEIFEATNAGRTTSDGW